MRYKLLSIRGMNETNIGDYVQALASAQFFPKVDGFIDRETLRSYNGDACKVIMNGWYMHHPEQWPPSDKIIPLYVAVHFNSLAIKNLLADENIAYLKKHEPIGCRDMYTTDLLKSKGVDAYFSGCMTLTLGEKYRSEIKEDKCYFVDPYFVTHWSLYSVIYNIIYLLLHWKPISKISAKHPDSKTGLRKKMIITTFYREYKKFFSRETLVNAEYICQQNKDYKVNFPTDKERLAEAERLVQKYAKAKLVVTSRIHCALPCLGLGTPVIYTEDAQQSQASACRFGGLRELFNVLKWNKNHLEQEFKADLPLNNISGWKNKDNWKPLAQALIKRCSTFVKA